MNKSANENTQRGQKMPNYAQAARSTPSKPQSERQRSQHKQQQQQQQQQQEDASVLKSSSAGSASTHHHKNLYVFYSVKECDNQNINCYYHNRKNKEYNNSNTNHTNNNGFKKAPVQLPMQPPSTDTGKME
jgi:hypothetical protein